MQYRLKGFKGSTDTDRSSRLSSQQLLQLRLHIWLGCCYAEAVVAPLFGL